MIRVLTPADIPACLRLKEAAGWNQTAADWELVIRLSPQGCYGFECDGTLAATTTAVTYGNELAWIGMVLTAPEFRGRGFARSLMVHALEALDRAGVPWVKLDATDMGYPLYSSLGFVDECFVERWGRPAGTGGGGGGGSSRPMGALSAADLESDRAAFGADRAALLGALAGGESLTAEGDGFAMMRPGSKAAYLGPVVAQGADAAEGLIRALLVHHPEQPVYWDVLSANPAARLLAGRLGFSPLRRLIRMARAIPGASPPQFLHNDSYVFALAGFEYG